jgi:hypothetical protein
LVHLIVVPNVNQDDVVFLYDDLQHDAVTHVDGNRREWGEPPLQAMHPQRGVVRIELQQLQGLLVLAFDFRMFFQERSGALERAVRVEQPIADRPSRGVDSAA